MKKILHKNFPASLNNSSSIGVKAEYRLEKMKSQFCGFWCLSISDIWLCRALIKVSGVCGVRSSQDRLSYDRSTHDRAIKDANY